MGKEIYHTSLDLLKDSLLDITPHATPHRYRLLDCDQLANHQYLRIREFTDISSLKYAAISYVWRGTPVDAASTANDRLGTFIVKGAEAADPISIDVLLQACKAAHLRSLPYLWLDRICIVQTSSDDKQWQIKNMYGIYKECDVCLVFPGGIGRLVSLEDETSWIQRAWTLQEVMAPKFAMVIFIWKHEEDLIEVGNGQYGIQVITPLECAMMKMEDIFATNGRRSYTTISTTRHRTKFSANIAILGNRNHVYSLVGAMTEREPETKAQAIWKSALMRTSSRPVDMIFSIMGILGVTLNPNSFDVHDREGATIALAQKILANGGRASWLGVAYSSPPTRTLSAFPIFPKSSVSGKAYIEVGDKQDPVEQIIEDSFVWLNGLPEGSMDDAGYLNFRAKAVRLIPLHSNHRATEASHPPRSNPSQANTDILKGQEFGRIHITAMDESVWQIVDKSEKTSSTRHYAISLGTLERFLAGWMPMMFDPSATRVLLVEQHGIGKVHRKSYFAVGDVFKPFIDEWDYHDFSLGGPEPSQGTSA